MNYSDYRFTLDIQIHQAQVSVPVTFGDSARRLCIGLTDGRKPYVIGEGCRAVFNAKKPDGNVIKNDCIIERNVILYEFTEQTTNSEGIVNCDITLYDVDGKVLTSPQFIIVVDKRVVRDAEAIATRSGSESTTLDNIISSENQRVEAEAYRAERENYRASAETLRVSNEFNRVEAENYRNQSEAYRVTAESARVEAEAGRRDAFEANEEARQAEFDAAEVARNEAENMRKQAEIERNRIVGDMNTALDAILAKQNQLIGGETV